MTRFSRRAAVAIAAAAAALPARAADAEPHFQFVEGDPNAKVTVIEYASLTCSHCGHFHRDTYPEIKKTFVDSGKVRWIFRHFPLDSLAMAGAVLTACAPEGKGRTLFDTLFKNQEAWVLSQTPIEPLKGYAQVAGMTGDDVEACLRNRALMDEFRAELNRNSETHNVEATPAFFIGEENFQGAPDLADLTEILDKQLAAAK
jgi:protein-disulfide isomerase